MGLDGVELVMEIEERFGISISDQDAQNIFTVGDCYNLIESKIAAAGGVQTDACLSSSVFYRFRRGLIKQFGVSKSSITLGAAMNELIPLQDRGSAWEGLSDAIELALPRLKRPAWIESTIALTGLIGFLGCIFGMLISFNFVWAGIFLLVASWVLWELSKPFAVYLPKTCGTVR